MPPRKAKAKKPAAEPKPRRSTRGAKADAVDAEEPVLNPPSDEPEQSSEVLKGLLPPTAGDVADAVENVLAGPSTSAATEAAALDDSMAVDEQVATEEAGATADSIPDVEMEATGAVTVVQPVPAPSGLTIEERQAKLQALRSKMVWIFLLDLSVLQPYSFIHVLLSNPLPRRTVTMS